MAQMAESAPDSSTAPFGSVFSQADPHLMIGRFPSDAVAVFIPPSPLHTVTTEGKRQKVANHGAIFPILKNEFTSVQQLQTIQECLLHLRTTRAVSLARTNAIAFPDEAFRMIAPWVVDAVLLISEQAFSTQTLEHRHALFLLHAVELLHYHATLLQSWLFQSLVSFLYLIDFLCGLFLNFWFSLDFNQLTWSLKILGCSNLPRIDLFKSLAQHCLQWVLNTKLISSSIK
jgi:hypothetical protein